MRKYTSDVKTNGIDSSELDPCLAARSRQKKTFLAKWKKWIIIGVVLFVVLLLITLGFLLFFLLSPSEAKPTMDYVHQELESPRIDYDAEDVETAGAGSRSLPYSHRNSHEMYYEKELTDDSPPRTSEELQIERNPVMIAVTTTTTSTTSEVQTAVTDLSTQSQSPLTSTTPEKSTTSTTSSSTTTTTSTTTAEPSSVPHQEPPPSIHEEPSDPKKSTALMSDEVKKDCSVHIEAGGESGLYMISPDGADAFTVYCDQKTAGGGWTVIQRRLDSSVYFYNRTWQEYEDGFGNIDGSHWLGLSKIYRLSPRQGEYWVLRIELRGDYCSGKSCLNQENGYWWAEWPFRLGEPSSGYVLDLGRAKAGNLTDSDSLFEKFNSGRAFTAIDRDNDGVSGMNCAQFRNYGGWWHGDCGYVALNGLYGDKLPTLRYMVYTYSNARHRKFYIHPKKSLMMIRPGSVH